MGSAVPQLSTPRFSSVRLRWVLSHGCNIGPSYALAGKTGSKLEAFSRAAIFVRPAESIHAWIARYEAPGIFHSFSTSAGNVETFGPIPLNAVTVHRELGGG